MKTAALEPDRDQIEIFVDALFRHAPENTYVSLRAFGHDNKAFRITPVRLNGKGLKFLCDAAVDDARRAAQYPTPIVFCPPIAVFSNKDKTREEDLAAGLALSAELDANPHEARRALEGILGPPTIVVRSGGTWVNGHAEPEDKLHVHWRLATPAVGDNRARLKEARRLATVIAGGDASNVPTVHPLRWPGSWHRKGAPRLCEIAHANPDREIDLDAALAALRAAATAEEDRGDGADSGGPHERGDWAELINNIIAGRDLHLSANRLGASFLASGMDVRGATRAIEALFLTSDCPRDERWKARFNDIGRAVRSAKEKFGKPGAEGKCPLPEQGAKQSGNLRTN